MAADITLIPASAEGGTVDILQKQVQGDLATTPQPVLSFRNVDTELFDYDVYVEDDAGNSSPAATTVGLSLGSAAPGGAPTAAASYTAGRDIEISAANQIAVRNFEADEVALGSLAGSLLDQLKWLAGHGGAVIAAPTITGFLPMSGAQGSTIVLTGTGFVNVAQFGVSINSAAVARFTVDTDNLNWTVRVPNLVRNVGTAYGVFDLYDSAASISVRSAGLGVVSGTPVVTQPPGDVNVVFYDPFDRPDGAVGNDWVHDEFFTLVNGSAVAADTFASGHPPMLRPIAEAGDRQRATGTFLFNNTGRTPGLITRSDNAGNYYMLYCTDFGTQYGMAIYRVNSGLPPTQLGVVRSSSVLNPGSLYRISFVAYDDQLVGTVLAPNGQPLGEGLRVTNASFTSGVCGLTSNEVGTTFLDFQLSTV
jgi:hypothetical protein